MSRILILLLCCFLFGNASFGQTYSSVVSDKEIHEFINWMISEDINKDLSHYRLISIDNKITAWNIANFTQDTILLKESHNYSPEDGYLLSKGSELNKLFDNNDSAFIMKQFVSIKDTIWRKGFLWRGVLSKKYHKETKSYEFSIPLFSNDRKYVMVHKTSSVGFRYFNKNYGVYIGNSTEESGVYIYEKIGPGKWKFVTVTMISITAE